MDTPHATHRTDITPVHHGIARQDRARRFGHGGCVVWLTGLSASGKSTLAMALEEHLSALGYACYALDGDNLRKGLNSDLGFSPAERSENIRRVGEVGALFAHAGMVCITALISPYREDRLNARAAAQAIGVPFFEVHVAANLATCEARDPKGLYRKARSGQLPSFTGIDAPYEVPEAPDLVVESGQEGVQASVARLVGFITGQEPIGGPGGAC